MPPHATIVSFPAHAASRRMAIELIGGSAATERVVAAVEGDPALVLAVLFAANRRSHGDAGAASVGEAVQALTRSALVEAVQRVPVIEPLDHDLTWGRVPQRLRLHALAVRSVADQLLQQLGPSCRLSREVLGTAALLHDVGKLELHLRHPDYWDDASVGVAAPEARVLAERRAYGVDHAELGGALARDMNLPEAIAVAIECHHADADGCALLLRVADMLCHYARERPIDLGELVEAAAAAGLDRDALGSLMYELAEPAAAPRSPREACPLTARELEVVRCMAEGMVPKEIAGELLLSPSTVRNHLHRIYTRLGVTHRTQAVMVATERGWL